MYIAIKATTLTEDGEGPNLALIPVNCTNHIIRLENAANTIKSLGLGEYYTPNELSWWDYTPIMMDSFDELYDMVLQHGAVLVKGLPSKLNSNYNIDVMQAHIYVNETTEIWWSCYVKYVGARVETVKFNINILDNIDALPVFILMEE